MPDHFREIPEDLEKCRFPRWVYDEWQLHIGHHSRWTARFRQYFREYEQPKAWIASRLRIGINTVRAWKSGFETHEDHMAWKRGEGPGPVERFDGSETAKSSAASDAPPAIEGPVIVSDEVDVATFDSREAVQWAVLRSHRGMEELEFPDPLTFRAWQCVVDGKGLKEYLELLQYASGEDVREEVESRTPEEVLSMLGELRKCPHCGGEL